ncbi:MAG: YecR family lipoprotein [Parvibaculales bacterium]
MRKLSIAVVSVSFLAAGCGTVVPGISDVDKSKPSVELTGVINMFQPKIDWAAGQQKAVRQCREFDHDGARPLEMERKRCQNANCSIAEITRTFVCTEK